MRIQNLFVSVLIIFVLISGIFPQQDKTKDQTLRGSGRVNPSTLAMEFDLPLGNYQESEAGFYSFFQIMEQLKPIFIG